MTLTDKITGAVLVSLFIFAFLMFGYQAQLENGLEQTILDDPHFKGFNDTLSKNLSRVRGIAESQGNLLFGTPPKSGDDDSFGLLTIPRTIFNFISLGIDSIGLVTGLLENVFGVPSIIFNVLGGILLITILLLGWRVIKAGGT